MLCVHSEGMEYYDRCMTNMHIGVLIGANFRRGIRTQFADDVRRREGGMGTGALDSSFINRLCRLSQEANMEASSSGSQHQDSK